MNECLVEYSVTWWILMGALGLTAGALGGLIVSIIIPLAINAIKEARVMFGKKKVSVNISGDKYYCYSEVWPAIDALSRTKATSDAFEHLEAMMKEEAVRLGVIEDTIIKNLSEGQFVDSLVECEKCGCLLRKGTAIRGESVIEKTSSGFNGYVYMDGAGELCASDPSAAESIREVYYCKAHKPKVKK